MKTFIVAAALAGTMLSGSAIAAQTTPPAAPAAEPQAPMQHRMSHDPMTRADYVARATKRFARMDANGDGVVTADEMTGPRRNADQDAAKADRWKQRMMGRLDANHDGKISTEEMTTEAGTRFDTMDANHDGTLDSSERSAPDTRMQETTPPPAAAPNSDPGQ